MNIIGSSLLSIAGQDLVRQKEFKKLIIISTFFLLISLFAFIKGVIDYSVFIYLKDNGDITQATLYYSDRKSIDGQEYNTQYYEYKYNNKYYSKEIDFGDGFTEKDPEGEVYQIYINKENPKQIARVSGEMKPYATIVVSLIIGLFGLPLMLLMIYLRAHQEKIDAIEENRNLINNDIRFKTYKKCNNLVGYLSAIIMLIAMILSNIILLIFTLIITSIVYTTIFKIWFNIIKKEKIMKEEKGITLIALVITIIVMLILTGATIAVVTQGGLLTKAQEAKTLTEGAQENELNQMNTVSNEIDLLLANTSNKSNITEEPTIALTDEGFFDFDETIGTITAVYATLNNEEGGQVLPTEINIPTTIDGVSVTTIGGYVFNGNQLTSVIIGDSVTTIEEYAFCGNQLTSVTIGSSVRTIGQYAFCDNPLNSVTIPNSVITIENGAFISNQLNSVIIGSNVTTIGNVVFANNQLQELVIPDSVTTIGYAAFASNALTVVTIGSSVTTIGESTFSDNENLATINICKIDNSIPEYENKWGAPTTCAINWNYTPE